MKRTQQAPVFNNGDFVGVVSLEYDDYKDEMENMKNEMRNMMECQIGILESRLMDMIQSFNQRLEEAGGVPFDEEELRQFLSSY